MTTPFQKMYDTIKNWKAPQWFYDLMGEIQTIIISILMQVGKSYIDQITDKIIDIAKEDIPPEAKFERVFEYVRVELGLSVEQIKDSALNLLIEMLVSKCKADKTI